MRCNKPQKSKKEQLEKIVTQMRLECPNILLMADIATLVDVKVADELGFELVGTTKQRSFSLF